MIQAIVLHLEACASHTLRGGTGRAVHGFWFEQWRQTMPAVADLLHPTTDQQESQADLPYTLSPLLGLPRPQRGVTTISTGTRAAIRITTLHPDLTRPLLSTWITQLPSMVTIAGVSWRITGLSLAAEEHQAAGHGRYEALLAHPFWQEPKKWTLSLNTPTTFRTGRSSHLPFPLPDALVKSWLRRWQAFSPVPFDEELVDRVRAGLLVSAYDLKTVPVRYGRSLTIGCVGKITLTGPDLTAEDCAAVTTLAHYAFFCGSGYHTTQGLGQTRLETRPVRRSERTSRKTNGRFSARPLER